MADNALALNAAPGQPSLDDFLKTDAAPAQAPADAQSLDDFLAGAAPGAPSPTTLRNNMQFSVNAQPDKEASYKHLGAAVGVPIDTVRAQPDAIKTQAALQQFPADAIASKYPETAKILASLDNTRMLHDDVPNMTAIEGTMQAWQPSWGQRLSSWIGSLFDMPAQERAQAANLVAEQQLGISAGQARAAVGGESELPEQFAGQAVHVGTLGLVPNRFGEAQTAAGRVGAGAGSLLGFVAGAPVKAAAYGLGRLGVTGTLGAMGGGSLLTSTLASAGNTAATLGAAGALGEAGNALNSPSAGEALGKIGAAAGSNALTGATFGAVGRLLPKNTLAQLIGRVVANNAATDLAQGNRPWDERPVDQKIMDYGLNTLFSLHGMPPAESEAIQNAGSAAAATEDAQRVAGLSQLFTASKFRDRDPEQFKQFVSDVADRAGTPDLYVDAKQFAQVLDQSGVSADELSQTMPGVAKQMREGLQTEGMVQLPIEDYAQHIAGSKVDEALQPHLRTSPDGMTFAEAQQYYQDNARSFADQAKVADARVQDEAFRQSGQQVEDTVQQQLDATGRFPKDVNSAYAKMWRAFFETTASKTGQLPHEVMAQYPAEVRSDQLTRPSLDQEAAPERTVSVPGFGDVKFNQQHDVELLGGSSDDGSTVYADRSWKPVAKLRMADGTEKDVDRSPFLGVHELRERALEGQGWSYTDAHNQAEREEDAAVRAAGIDPKSYQESYDGEIKDAAKKADTGNPPPDIVAKPYEHPDSQRAREALGRVEQAENNASGESSASLEAQHRVADEKAAGQTRAIIRRDGSVEPLYGVDAVDTHARAGEVVVQHGVGREPWTVLSHGDDLSRDVAQGKVNRALADLEGLRSYNQPSRGSIAFDERGIDKGASISLFKGADLSTFLHESGHFFLEVYSDLAGKMGADSAVGKDMQRVLDWFGVKDVAAWRDMSLEDKRDFHEQFARGFEQYLMSGKAPTMELQSLYGRFRAWLVNVYKSMTQLHVSLTDDVRGVMDRMLASQDMIERTQAARGMLPMFHVKPDGMTDDAWGRYQDELRQSTEDAISDLQAKSIKDMRWASNAKDRAIRSLQREARNARADIREQVTKQVAESPLRQAEQYLKSPGQTDTGFSEASTLWKTDRERHEAETAAEIKAEYLTKPEARGLKGIEKGQYLARVKREMANEVERHMLAWERENPKPVRQAPDAQIVAEMFGFSSGETLKKAIRDAGSMKGEIEGLTDQRMLEEHGELVDPQSIERAAESAIHNDVRTRVLARELNALAKATGPARLLAKAAGEAAESAIGARKVRDVNPHQFQAQEGRAGKAALDALKKGDTATAAVQKRAQLLNNQLARKAQDAREDIAKALTYFKRFQRVNPLKAMALEEREQVLKLLSAYDFRTNPSAKPSRAQENLHQWLESQQLAGYSPLVDETQLAATPRTGYRDMTVSQLRGLYDTVRSIEKIGRDKLTALWDGQQVALDDLVRNTFVPKMQERGDKFTADQIYSHENNRDAGRVKLALDRMGSALRAMGAELKPQYFKANQFDMHDTLGPFHELFNQVFEANYRKLDLMREQSARARDLAATLGRDWQTSMFDSVPNTQLADAKASEEAGRTVLMRLTRDNLIQIAAHAGNESNFDKLAKGYGWKPEDVWAFLDGKLTAKDAEAVKAQWEWANQYWPEVKAQYERLGQVVPPKIEPRPYALRLADGSTVEMPGGYMPIRYDPLRSRLGDKQQAERVIKEGEVRLGYDFFGRDTTTNGSMNARVDGYTDAIDLRHEALEQALKETVHDLAYREPLINANKIISHPDFKSQFFKSYGREQYDALYTWLGRIANSENIDRQVGALGRFLRYTRTGMVMNAIALRASTVLKHGGSAAIKSAGYFVGGGEKYYLARQAAMAYDYKAQLQEAFDKFPEIRARAMQQDRDYRQTVGSLFKPESLQSRAERFGHAAVAYADLFTAVATAHGAYDRAVTEGVPKNQGGTGAPLAHDQAVRYANQVVREAHGSQIESARSNLMTNPHEGVKLFTTLYGFMNNTLGQATDMADAWRTGRMSHPVIAARAMAALIVPALWAGVVQNGWPSKDDWGKWGSEALASEGAGMLPFGRDVYAFLAGYQHAGIVGVENWLQAVTQPAKDVAHAAEGKKVANPIAHAADAAGMGLHIPGLGQLGHSAQYLYNVHTGKERPKNAGELAEGVLLGHGQRKH